MSRFGLIFALAISLLGSGAFAQQGTVVSAGGSPTPAALTKGDDTNVTLTLGGSPSTALLNAASITAGWTGSLAAPRGGTGQTSYAVGDILYASTTTALSKLAGVATGNAIISGGVNTAPAYGKIGLTTHISGILGVANGGTGASTTATSGRYLKGDGSVWGTSTGAASGTGACGAGDFVSTLNADAAPTCTTPAGGAPGGATTQIQFKDAGAFGGDAQLTFTKTTGAVVIDSSTAGANVAVFTAQNNSLTGTPGIIFKPNNGSSVIKINQGNSGGGLQFRDFNDAELITLGRSTITGSYWNIPGTGFSPIGDFIPGTDNQNSIGDVTHNVKTVFTYTTQLKAVAIGSLPASPVLGMVAAVTDANTPIIGSTVAAGGSAKALVWYNGANWTVSGI